MKYNDVVTKNYEIKRRHEELIAQNGELATWAKRLATENMQMQRHIIGRLQEGSITNLPGMTNIYHVPLPFNFYEEAPNSLQTVEGTPFPSYPMGNQAFIEGDTAAGGNPSHVFQQLYVEGQLWGFESPFYQAPSGGS